MILPQNARILGPGQFREIASQMQRVSSLPPMTAQAANVRRASFPGGILEGWAGTPMQLDMGRTIAMLGYDGYIPYNTVYGYHRPEIVLLNRSAAVYDRIPQQVWGGLL
jgi:hypothetical protein